MRGSITAIDSSGGKVEFDSRLELYRSPENHQVIAEAGGESITLGLADVTVSRKTDDRSPVVIQAQESHFNIQNKGNSNGVVIESSEGKVELNQGQAKRVSETAEIRIGHNTSLRLSPIQPTQAISDDIVEQSTSVSDSVINRSEIGTTTSTNSEDTAIYSGSDKNDSNSPDDTQTSSASKHEPSRVNNVETDSSNNTTVETDEEATEIKYCLYCGQEVSAQADYCPSCGEALDI